jgi:hypothetical protein
MWAFDVAGWVDPSWVQDKVKVRAQGVMFDLIEQVVA